jgi:hypothetical protein
MAALACAAMLAEVHDAHRQAAEMVHRRVCA